MLTEQQAESIKEQLLKQLEHFPEDQRRTIRDKIISMNIEEIEEFIKQNQLVYSDKKKEIPATNCIFCNISTKKVPSFIIDEDIDNLAVLEINPLSKGHSIIIPKKHVEIERIPATTFKIAKKISHQIKKKFQPKEIKITAQKILGHSLVEVLPLYGNETERKKANEQELKEIQKMIEIIKKEKTKKKPIEKKEVSEPNLPRLKPRLP